MTKPMAGAGHSFLRLKIAHGLLENNRWQKTTSCPSRRTNIRTCLCVARPAVASPAWLAAFSTLEVARRFACIGANAARAFGRSRASSGCPNAARLRLHGNSIQAWQDQRHYG